MVLNEAAVLVACVALFGAILLKVPKAAFEEIKADGQKALDAAGGVNVLNFREALKQKKSATP